MQVTDEERGYHAAGFIFRDMLFGTVNQTNYTQWTRSYSSISQTPLLDQVSQYVVNNFSAAVEQQFATQILSLSTTPVLYAQVNITAPCTMSTTILVWNYKPFWLILSYSLAIGLTLLATVEGFLALKRNGYAADTNFSTILATTRNAALDEIADGHCLGQLPMRGQFLQNKLMFGDVGVVHADALGGGSGRRHAAFGMPNEVQVIRVRERYI